MPFAAAYVTHVLSENFEDAKALFLSPLMAIHYAHLVMLARQDIVGPADAHAVREALDQVDVAAVRGAAFDGSVEDLFFHVERLVEQVAGEEPAGRLHTARSRNDIDMTMYRMRVREYVLEALDASLGLRAALLALAARHRETVFPAHTHTQPAQPSTVAHYLLAMIEQLERDAGRLRAAFVTANRNPLGACAITGTGFPIDRALTSALLGFDGPTGNTYGSIATVDYLLESAAATAVMLVGLGRFVQDMLLWCTSEMGYLRLGDGYVQKSSIMPQKRNPVALEHARALASKALGETSAIASSVHNTPFGDIVDTEDDLQPLVYAAFRDARRAVTLVGAALSTAEFDTARMAERAGTCAITVTELADTLTRDEDLSFRTSHAITTAFVRELQREAGGSIADALARASTAVIGRTLPYDEQALGRILSPMHFVTVRKTPGGPAPAEVGRALEVSAAALEADRAWLAERVEALKAAERQLEAAAASL